MEDPQTQMLGAVSEKLLNKVQELLDKEKIERDKMRDEILTLAAGFKSPVNGVAQPSLDQTAEKLGALIQEMKLDVANVKAALDSATGAPQPGLDQTMEKMYTLIQGMRTDVARAQSMLDSATVVDKSLTMRVRDTFGFPTWEPAPVPFSKQQALSLIAAHTRSALADNPDEVLQTAARAGAMARDIEAAFDAAIVQAPKAKGLSPWTIAGMALAGTVVVGAAAAGGYYGHQYLTRKPEFEPGDTVLVLE